MRARLDEDDGVDWRSHGTPTPSQTGAVLLLVRALLAPLFLYSGWGKASDLTAVSAELEAAGFPLSTLFALAAIAIELIASVSLAVGFMTRSAAIALLGYSILATVLFHNFWAAAPSELHGQAIQFTKNLGIVGGLVVVAWFGAGRYSLDHVWTRESSS